MYKGFLKRLFDLIFAIIGLPFLILIILIVGPIIYFQDKGSIFYNASRLGKDGKVFKMFKFRSMKMNAPDLRNEDGSTFNSEEDTRMTKIGKILRKSSIDETPQLLNIIRGEMSFIGPRPDLPEHRAFYEGIETRKLEIRPGITGYSQAYFRNNISWKERIVNDIFYIDNITLSFDLRIFIKTIVAVLSRKDVYNPKSDNLENVLDKNRGEDV